MRRAIRFDIGRNLGYLGHLYLRLGSHDLGVVQTGPLSFECVLTKEGWSEVADLMEPFCEPENMKGYQWLNEDGEVSLLLSPDGLW